MKKLTYQDHEKAAAILYKKVNGATLNFSERNCLNIYLKRKEREKKLK